MRKYVIGIDYGTLSGRAVLVDAKTGEQVAQAVYEYPHAVMDGQLPGGKKLPTDWALQHPQDYIDVLSNTIPNVLSASGVSADDVIGIGTDFTACTLLPVKKDGTPLCFLREFENEPNAYVKLWKHHAAQDKANKLNEIAETRGEKWVKNYGGKISSEWAIPKIWQVLDESPDIYNQADRFIEAADWIIWQLCGKEVRNSCTAGYKAMWNKKSGYPSKDFFAALDPKLENVVEEKLGTTITSLGEKAGEITEEAAKLTGLRVGTAVAVGNVDAHVCVPAAGIDGPGKMLAIIGTSTCHIMMGEEEKQVPGMCGVVEDGVMPGYFGYESGQSCVGDHFKWFIENCLPESYINDAKSSGMDIHAYLTEKAEQLKPGESGLLALDWWNGNRSVLVDVDLSGMMLGMTLQTKPEEIYRALIEATAYGTREIVENYRANGVPVNEFYASGGISQKNPMMMQIYADVLNMPVKITSSNQGPAFGSAIFASVAAGEEKGGWNNIFDATRAMGSVKNIVYAPNEENSKIYDALFSEYVRLHDYFGRGENDVMKILKNIKISQKGNADNA
ncbi:MAG: ribulokinase [Faecalibacterium sp.]|nr:ribulokinase [Ruminococcus sp.]MCM1391986.1 ribulokinase [Ruminococcus sp.]MCM1485583.1 ribulokinase [Faecalibacterium sp.]